MDNLKVLADRLESRSQARRVMLPSSANALPTAPADPALRFQPGARILDLATGKRGTVIDGVRDEASGGQLYALELVAGVRVIRSLAEIASDQLPTSPANR